MKLDRLADAASLSALGAEAVRLLCSEDVNGLASRFGYALAFEREPAVAIREDLRSCLAEVQAASLVHAPKHTPTVTYLEPNDSGLFAVVECVALTDNGAKVLVELVVTDDQGDKHLRWSTSALRPNSAVVSDAYASALLRRASCSAPHRGR